MIKKLKKTKMSMLDDMLDNIFDGVSDRITRATIIDRIHRDINLGHIILTEEEKQNLMKRELPKYLKDKVEEQYNLLKKNQGLKKLVHQEVMNSNALENLEKCLFEALGDNPTIESIVKSVRILKYLGLETRIYRDLFEIINKNGYFEELPLDVQKDLNSMSP